MGHLGNLKREYRSLLERLDGGQVGLPEPKHPEAARAWLELLEIYYTPAEARLAAQMPFQPTRLERLADVVHLPLSELRPLLDAMCDKGIVMDLRNPDTGTIYYFLSPPVVGFFEFSMMRVHDMFPKKRLAEALHAYKYADRTFAEEVFGGETVIGRTLVGENLLDDETLPDVLDYQRATALIERARHLAVSICYCRHLAEHLGEDCDAPKENCLSLNTGADLIARRGFGRAIDRVEALEVLAASRESGLVQIADNVRDRPTYICNCCGCCCGQLRGINDWNLPAVKPSGFVPVVDDERCKGCSRCSRACPIAAIVMSGERASGQRKTQLRPRIDLERCIGCGVCAQRCKREAMRMKPRGKPPYVPLNVVERITRMSLERGKLAHLLLEQANLRGNRFLFLLVRALTRLGPAERLIASEQLKSRFVRFTLGKVDDPTAVS